MNITNAAAIACPELPNLPPLATVASVDGEGQLWLRTQTAQTPAEPWRTEFSASGDMCTRAAEGTVGLFYRDADDGLGIATSFIVDRYLDEAYIPHDMRVAPAGVAGWNAIGIKSETMHTVPVAVGERTDLSAYVHVSFTEFAGSALYVVHRSLHMAGPRQIRSVKCNNNQPSRFPFTQSFE